MKGYVKKSVSLLLAFVIFFSSAGTGLTGVFASAATDSTVYKYNGISFTLNEDEEATIVSYTGDESDIVIPETVKKYFIATRQYAVT